MPMQLVYLWSARAKHAVIMRLPSCTLSQRAALHERIWLAKRSERIRLPVRGYFSAAC